MPSKTAKPGMALILVLAILALAAILGYAMLATATLSAQFSNGSKSIAASDTVAESGVELAMYYLQHPDQAPSLNSQGFWSGGTDFALGDGSIVSRIDVTQTAPNTYKIVSTSGGSSSRTITAVVYVNSVYEVKYVIAANTSTDLSRATVNLLATSGTPVVRVDGTVNLASSLLGTVLSLGSNLTGWSQTPSYPVRAAPISAEINILSSMPYYTFNGKVCVADELTSSSINARMTPDLSRNPANVWYTTSTVNLIGNNTFNGTLVVTGSTSDLKVQGSALVTPSAGMPAVVVQRNLELSNASSNLEVIGLTYVGEQLTSANSTIILGLLFKPNLKIYGALMLGTADSLVDPTSGYSGNLTIKFTPENLVLPDLSSYGQTPTSVKVLSWK